MQRVFSAPVSASQREEPTLEPDDGVALEPALLGELVAPEVDGEALGEALLPEVVPLVWANAADMAKSAEAVAAAKSFNVICAPLVEVKQNLATTAFERRKLRATAAGGYAPNVAASLEPDVARTRHMGCRATRIPNERLCSGTSERPCA